MVLIKPKVRTKIELIPKELPEGFVLIVDTREKDSFFSKPPKGLHIVRDTLQTGDYSIKGLEQCVAVERKELSDLYNTIGANRDRFKKELLKLKNFEWAGLVIEAPEDTVLMGNIHTSLHMEQIRWSLVSFEIKYGLHIYYSKNRESAERWTLDRLTSFYKYKRKGEI